MGQSTGDIRHKLQKIWGTDGRNLEALLDEAWRVFSSGEEGYKQGMRKLVSVVNEERKTRLRQGPPRQGPSQLGRDQGAICKKFGRWKKSVPRSNAKWKQLTGKGEPEKGGGDHLGERMKETRGFYPRRSTSYKNEAGERRERGGIFNYYGSNVFNFKQIFNACGKRSCYGPRDNWPV